MVYGWLTELTFGSNCFTDPPHVQFYGPSTRNYAGTTIPRDVAAFLVFKLGDDITHIVSTLAGASWTERS